MREKENKTKSMINTSFRRASDGDFVDPIEYTKRILEEAPDTQIYVGCDSQNVNAYITVYATVIVYRLGRRGAHVIYFKDECKKIPDLWTKLWGEVERSVVLANRLRLEGIEIFRIDLDFNKSPRFKSNAILKSATGYVDSMGYQYASKPEMLPSIRVANKLCRNRVGKNEGPDALIEE